MAAAKQKQTKSSHTTTNGVTGDIDRLLPPDYHPTPEEEFMNPLMKAYFRQKLVTWQEELLQDSSDTIHALQEDTQNLPDSNDRASTETDRAIELRARDRQRKLLNKIKSALDRIDSDEYGYCEDTGEPISIARLEARPIATMSIEAQEAHERAEKIHRDDD